MPSPVAVKPDFAKWLSYTRRSRALSQEDLAFRMGVGARTLRAWEAGHMVPSARSLRLIAEATNVRPLDLLAIEREADWWEGAV
jgi:transcriptional regulator with XRE-family HTH domain